MVDSEGTDWLNKLQSVKDEEQQHNKSQQLKWKIYKNVFLSPIPCDTYEIMIIDQDFFSLLQ